MLRIKSRTIRIFRIFLTPYNRFVWNEICFAHSFTKPSYIFIGDFGVKVFGWHDSVVI